MVWGKSQMQRGTDPSLEPCAQPGCTPFPSCCRTNSLRPDTSCSCVNFPSRRDTIRSSFCGQYPEDVYVATVVEATCNCVPMSANADVLDASIHCQNYTLSDTCTRSNVVYVHTLARGDCDYDRTSMDRSSYYDLYNCSATSERLVPASGKYEGPTSLAHPHPREKVWLCETLESTSLAGRGVASQTR